MQDPYPARTRKAQIKYGYQARIVEKSYIYLAKSNNYDYFRLSGRSNLSYLNKSLHEKYLPYLA